MRDIKFRAWNKKERVMCYANEDHTADYWDGVRLSTIEFINVQLSTNPYNEGLDSFSFRTNYEIMQYTGLKDKRGNEIYEGDICSVIEVMEHKGELKTKEYITDVKWDEGSFVVKSGREEYDTFISSWFEGDGIRYPQIEFEVIGNIYESRYYE